MIETVKIFGNNSLSSLNTVKVLRERLLYNNLRIIDDNNADLVISVGGDGTFLKTLKETNFNATPLYVGILCGHLGFLQEINAEEIDDFIDNLKRANYKIEKMSVLRTAIQTQNGIDQFYSLNEAVIREKDLKALHINLLIDGSLVEKFFGDGLAVSTSTGSTAHNLSFGGSIVHPELDVLQITHIAPINSSSYRSLNNSIIVPAKTKVCMIPAEGYSSDVLITTDGDTKMVRNVEKIDIHLNSKQIKILKFVNHCFWKRIQEKFL